jgi:hypothetical protein
VGEKTAAWLTSQCKGQVVAWRGGDADVEVEYGVIAEAPSKCKRAAQGIGKDEWFVKVDVFSNLGNEDGCYVCCEQKKGQQVPLSLVIVPRDDDTRDPKDFLPSEQRTSLLVSDITLPLTNWLISREVRTEIGGLADQIVV